MVRHLQLHKEVGCTHLQSEHSNKWIQEAYPYEGTTTPPRPYPWKNLVEITQFVWQNGEIMMELG